MAINIIVCMDRNGLIGSNNGLPWRLPEDLRYFKRVTEGNAIVMGRKTWDSLPVSPLPKRTNIVLTREAIIRGNINANPYHTFNTVGEVLLFEERVLANLDKDLFVIGGAEIYKLFLPYAENMFITEINHEFEGDIHFPEYNKSDWNLIGEQHGDKNEENPYDYSFKIYTRELTSER